MGEGTQISKRSSYSPWFRQRAVEMATQLYARHGHRIEGTLTTKARGPFLDVLGRCAGSEGHAAHALHDVIFGHSGELLWRFMGQEVFEPAVPDPNAVQRLDTDA